MACADWVMSPTAPPSRPNSYRLIGVLDDRGFRRAWVPTEFLFGAVVVDRQWRRILAGCDMVACRTEVVAEDLCQSQPGDRRAVR